MTTVLDSVDVIVFKMDAVARFVYLNQAWTTHTGVAVDDAIGRSIWELIDDADQRAHLRELAKANVAFAESRPVKQRAVPLPPRVITMEGLDGVRRSFEVRSDAICDGEGRVDGFAGTIVDVTDRMAQEIELRQAQKLEAVGALAAGIAHEINTPMQFVGDNVQFLGDSFTSLVALLGKYRAVLDPSAGGMTWQERQAYLEEAELDAEADYLQREIPRAVTEALEGADRVATIVRAMKAFGHPDGAQQRSTDLNEAIRNTITVARHEYKYVAEVVMDLGDVPFVMCHVGDINQALLNLVVNAAHGIEDAMTSNGERGTITVTSRVDGNDVVISVADTGSGIPAEHHERIFDPFFTTKDVGRGTGQGLAIVRAVVDRHQGRVSFTTSPDGTTFTICLPVAGVTSNGGDS